MGLRELAHKDLEHIMEKSGDTWQGVLTDPDGLTDTVSCITNDIGEMVDPDTGQLVTGRSAKASIRIQHLLDKGFTMPVGISDSTLKPWRLDFNDINGILCTFKIVQSNPDRTLGLVGLVLEAYVAP